MTQATTTIIGDAHVTRIGEITASFPAAKLLPGWTAEMGMGGMTPAEIRAGQLEISVHAWLVRTGTQIILVDAGVGNGKFRSLPLFNALDTPFLAHLAEAGVQPEDVTHVLLTHLHTDHVGWLTTKRPGGWVPTFPKARTILPQLGYDWFTTGEGRTQPNRDMFLDSVLPVIEAGNVGFMPAKGGTALDGFEYCPTPGHSVDHVSIVLQSGGAKAMFPGDVLHHPVQVVHPELSSMFCADPVQARQSRAWAIETAAEGGMTWFSSHFASPSYGRIGRSGGGYHWEFA